MKIARQLKMLTSDWLIDRLNDLLIDWCLTSTLAIFQLYWGALPFVETCFNNSQHDSGLLKEGDFISKEKKT
jgi:hypothetical protein